MIRGLLVGFVLVVPSMLRAEDRYVIQMPIRESARGPVLLSYESTTQVKSNAEMANGKVHANPTIETAESYKFREVRQYGRDNPDRLSALSWQFEEAETRQAGRIHVIPVEGKRVRVQVADGKPRLMVEGGGSLSPDDEERLSTLADSQPPGIDFRKSQLPRHAVAVGETWPLDVAAIVKEMGEGKPGRDSLYDLSAAVAEGKLARAYKKGAAQYVTVEFYVRLPLKDLAVGDVREAAEPGSYVDVRHVLDCCSDGSRDDLTLTRESHLKGAARHRFEQVAAPVLVHFEQETRTKITMKNDPGR